jgi:hypothetical protein
MNPLARSEAWELKAARMRYSKATTDVDGFNGDYLGMAEHLGMEEVSDALTAAVSMLLEKGLAADPAAAVNLADVLLRRMDFVVARVCLPDHLRAPAPDA